MPFLVVQRDSNAPYRSYETQAEAEVAARAASADLPAHLDGASVVVLHALPPTRPGARPRPDPDAPRLLAVYIDGKRIAED
jgi:hypothetical protein